jgi:hypothetical protein
VPTSPAWVPPVTRCAGRWGGFPAARPENAADVRQTGRACADRLAARLRRQGRPTAAVEPVPPRADAGAGRRGARRRRARGCRAGRHRPAARPSPSMRRTGPPG